MDNGVCELVSRRGQIELDVRVTENIKQGVVFIPFHFAEAAANALTNSAIDPVAKIPEYKVCAVKSSWRNNPVSNKELKHDIPELLRRYPFLLPDS